MVNDKIHLWAPAVSLWVLAAIISPKIPYKEESKKAAKCEPDSPMKRSIATSNII